MAQTKLSDLTALTTPDGAEELYINDGGTSKKITIANAIIAGTGITKSGATISAAPVALTSIQTASSESAQLALTAEEGDVVVRSDESKTYMHNGGSAGSMADYTLMATPTDSVTSVVGQTGVVSTAQIKTALENGIDSVHYVDGSIDTDHIGDDQVTAAKLANSINTEITANTAKTGITSGQTSAIVANTAKVGITTGQASAITANTAKTGITSGQASAITANTAKVTNATHTGDVTGATALTIAAGAVDLAMISATGTAGSGNFLRGDNSWSAVDGLPSQTGNAGKYLTTDASDASWATLDTDANTTTKGLYEHAHTIAANYSITSGNNALSAGAVTINSGVSVTIPTGSTWIIA